MMILVVGPPGSGKTFFSEHLAELIGAVHLNINIIRNRMGRKGRYDEKTENLAFLNLLDQAADYLASGRDVIVEGTYPKNEQRKIVADIARNAGLPAILIEILADDKTVEERLKNERKFNSNDIAFYRRMKNEYEPVTGERLILWSDREDLEVNLARAQKYIRG